MKIENHPKNYHFTNICFGMKIKNQIIFMSKIIWFSLGQRIVSHFHKNIVIRDHVKI